MDYIMTDAVTSPIHLKDQYSEKLAYMPKTFFIGDHMQMFPHMLQKAILLAKDEPNKYGDGTRDNIMLVNAIDLKPLFEKATVSVSVLFACSV